MSLRHMRIFVAVCSAGSMTAAAKQLFLSQPAVSLAISELEQDYNVKLFDRISNKLRLTESGEQLRQYAERIVYLYDEMEVIVPAILQNELDVAVVEGEVDNPYIQSVRIGVDPIMFICSPEHQGERHPSPEQAPHQERARLHRPVERRRQRQISDRPRLGWKLGIVHKRTPALRRKDTRQAFFLV